MKHRTDILNNNQHPDINTDQAYASEENKSKHFTVQKLLRELRWPSS